MRQAWVLCGVILVGFGAFLAVDPRARLEILGEAALRWWPVVLLAVALVNALIAVLPKGSWIAPMIPGVIGGAGLLFRLPEPFGGAERFLPALAVFAGAIAVARGLAGQADGSAAAVLISRHAEVDGKLGSAVVTRALLAELRVDLTEATWDETKTVRINVVMGRVKLRIPPTTPLVLEDGGTAVALRESGVRTPNGNKVTFKVGGAFGRIDIIRG